MLEKLKILHKHQIALWKYRRSKREPNKKNWLFSSTDNKCFNYNSKYLFDYVKKNYSEISAFYVINDEQKRQELNFEYEDDCFINTDTDEGIEMALSCKVWFTSAGLPIYAAGLYKDYDIINLWHGVPFKKILLDDKQLSLLSRIYFKTIFSRNYKYVVTTSKKLKPIMSRSFAVPTGKVKVFGQPRCDVLYKDNNSDEILKDLISSEVKYDRLVLYAPTFRDKEDTILFPFADYDKAELDKYLEDTDTLILVRRHISESADFTRYYSNRVLPFDDISDIMSVLNIFDALITDYSSIFIDYFKLDRKVIFLPYDKIKYMNDRGLNFKYEDIAVGYTPTSMHDFMLDLDKKDEFHEKRLDVMSILDTTKGTVSEKICQEIMGELGI